MITIGQYEYYGLIRSYLAQNRAKAKTAGNRLSYIGKNLY